MRYDEEETKYLTSGSDEEGSEESWSDTNDQRAEKTLMGRYWFFYMNIALFIFSTVALLHTWRLQSQTKTNEIKGTSSYSPMYDWVNISMQRTQVNGSVFEQKDAALSRKKPSPEVEDFWRQFEALRMYKISADDVVKMGKDPRTAVKFPESFGFGDDAYMATLDVAHEIHCLDSLRKIIFEEWEDYPTKMVMTMPRLYWAHASHCIDILYQSLTCSGSVDMLTYNWMQGQSHPFADFNIHRECRNWDTIMNYHFANTIEMTDELLAEFVRPEDQSSYAEVPAVSYQYEVFGKLPKSQVEAEAEQ